MQTRITEMRERYPLGEIQDALVIDIGAHVGEFALACVDSAKKIICFEPDSYVREALLANTKSSENIHVYPFALSDKNEEADFYISTEQADSSLFIPDRYTEIKSVTTKRLDDLNIDFSEDYSRVVLKMDAEGFEPEVLIGAESILQHINQVAIDVSPERSDEDTYEEVKTFWVKPV